MWIPLGANLSYYTYLFLSDAHMKIGIEIAKCISVYFIAVCAILTI